MNGLSILGTGRCLPDHIVTNDDLARRVETSNDWIVSRTGIRERRFAQGETLTQLAVAAARRAMERAGVGPQDIGLCLMATVTPDWITPSQACLLHQELGLPEDRIVPSRSHTPFFSCFVRLNRVTSPLA